MHLIYLTETEFLYLPVLQKYFTFVNKNNDRDNGESGNVELSQKQPTNKRTSWDNAGWMIFIYR